MNNKLALAQKWLMELGIKTEFHGSSLWVKRDDMVNIAGLPEQESYDYILKELKTALQPAKLFWGGKDDNWMFLESF